MLMGKVPSKDGFERSRFSAERYKGFLEAPFEISNKCCNVMKKSPIHKYEKETGRKSMTAQTASESRLRTQAWLKNGCNGFEMKSPISNPMSFWTEQDVLLYIYQNKLPIASVYGEVVKDKEASGNIDGQLDFSDLGLFDLGNPLLKTTGCKRTGCMFCAYGAHRKNDTRFVDIKTTHPKQYDFMLNKLKNNGITYKEAIDWTNEHIGLDIKY